MWLYDFMMWAGLASIAFGFAAALILAPLGHGRAAVRAAWNGWGLGIALLILAALAMSGSADEGDEADWSSDAPSGALGGGATLVASGATTGATSGGLSGEEAMMLPAFRDYATGISAAAADLEGLVGGSGEITMADEDGACDLGYAFADADPGILYVPQDSDALYELQEGLSSACESFGAACRELRFFSDRGSARDEYREGVKRLNLALRLLEELEAGVLPD